MKLLLLVLIILTALVISGCCCCSFPPVPIPPVSGPNYGTSTPPPKITAIPTPTPRVIITFKPPTAAPTALPTPTAPYYYPTMPPGG